MRNKIKFGIIFVALILIATALIVGFSKIGKLETTKTLSSLSFDIGTVSTTDGKNQESKQAIYLKDYEKLEDAKIEMKEDAKVTYKMFYYNANKEFISASEEFSVNYDKANNAEGAVYFRMVITPAQVDGEAVTINLLNIAKYTNQISVTVAK